MAGQGAREEEGSQGLQLPHFGLCLGATDCLREKGDAPEADVLDHPGTARMLALDLCSHAAATESS